MKKSCVQEFIGDCFTQVQADGYQQNFDMDQEFIPPDDYYFENGILYLQYGEEKFKIVVSKVRKNT